MTTTDLTTVSTLIARAEKAAEAFHAIVWGDPSEPSEGSEQVFVHEGSAYIIISGTGDCDGGAFAFDAIDVEIWAEGAGEDADYQDFCDSTSPEEDEGLARAVYRELGVELFRAGSCVPVLEGARAVIADAADDIEALARECAAFALEQGATAPWGDGDTCIGGDWDALIELLGREPGADELRTWDRAFRAAVEAG